MTDAGLTFTSDRRLGGIIVLKLVGPLVLQNIFALQKELQELKPRVMIFDVSEVPYIDSAGMGVLINYYVSAEKNGRRMALVAANQRLQALLTLTKVQHLLRNFGTVEEAEAKA